MHDASAVMQLLLKTQTDFNDLEDDDPQVSVAFNREILVKLGLNIMMLIWTT